MNTNKRKRHTTRANDPASRVRGRLSSAEERGSSFRKLVDRTQALYEVFITKRQLDLTSNDISFNYTTFCLIDNPILMTCLQKTTIDLSSFAGKEQEPNRLDSSRFFHSNRSMSTALRRRPIRAKRARFSAPTFCSRTTTSTSSTIITIGVRE